MATTSSTAASASSNVAATGSVIDVASIVSGLMQIESRPLDTLNAKIAASNTKISVLGQFQSKLSAVQTALDALQNPSNFVSTISSSNTGVATVRASANVVNGRYPLNVAHTAEAALINIKGIKDISSNSSSPFPSVKSAVPAGTYTLVIAGESHDHNFTDPSTLQQVADWINTLGGVQADVLQASDLQSVLTVRGLATGANQNITLTAPDSLDFEQTEAKDAVFSLNGIEFTRANNLVTDAIPGLTLNLIQQGNTVLQADNNDTAQAKTLLGNLVSSYNDLLDFYKTQTAASTDPAARGLFNSDYSWQSVLLQLQTALTRPLTDLQNLNLKNPINPTSTQAQYLDLLGLEFKSDGHLSLSDKLLGRSTRLQNVLANGVRIGYDATAAKDLSQSISAMLTDQGAVYARVQSEQALQRDMNKKKADLQDRLVRVQQQYTTQYAALDALLFKLNSTSTSLKGALDALSNSSKSN